MKVIITIEVGEEGVDWHFGQSVFADISKLLADESDKYISMVSMLGKEPKCEFSFVIKSRSDTVGVGGISYARGDL